MAEHKGFMRVQLGIERAQKGMRVEPFFCGSTKRNLPAVTYHGTIVRVNKNSVRVHIDEDGKDVIYDYICCTSDGAENYNSKDVIHGVFGIK